MVGRTREFFRTLSESGEYKSLVEATQAVDIDWVNVAFNELSGRVCGYVHDVLNIRRDGRYCGRLEDVWRDAGGSRKQIALIRDAVNRQAARFVPLWYDFAGGRI